MGGSRHIGFRASLIAERVSATSCVGKGRFLNVIFYHIELRNFDSIRRYRNEASMPSVLYLYAKNVSVRIQRICHYIIRDWRGLAELLILVKGNAKARLWDKQGCFSHVFFISIPQLSTSNAKTGRAVGKKTMNYECKIRTSR